MRKSLETYRSRPEVKLLPLYTTDEGASVPISSDTWPPTGSVLGLTKAEIADARAKGVKPTGGNGFARICRAPTAPSWSTWATSRSSA